MLISGSTVLLTGASGGLGQAIARALRQRGANLILIAAIAAYGSAKVDLAAAAEVDRLVGEAGDVDILVANAALPAAGTLSSFTVEEIERALAVNLRAPIVLAHALAPAMVERGRGHLLFMSSLAGKAATPGTSLYNATKYGLRGFASALRSDLRASGVGVSTVFPGFIRDAGMFAEADVKLPPGVGTRSPEHVAQAVLDAIERNRGEVDVAPLPLRVTAAFAGLAPELAAALARRLGSEEITRQMEAGQRSKR